jgi:hypothetical protein
MKKFLIPVIIIFAGLLSASCSQQEVEEDPQFLDVQLIATPEHAQVNEDITFEAKVTYGSEEVKDADEVKFEIWRAHAEDHEKIIVEHSENGIYSLKKSFPTEGTYYIISHVTARSMHNMPKIEFIVGSPSEPEESTSSQEMDMDAEENEEHNEH